MWLSYMEDEHYKEWKREQDKRIDQQIELEEKINRIAHPLKYKIIDAKDRFALWLLEL